jgi:DNA-binding beta-propeller fold protein YncE
LRPPSPTPNSQRCGLRSLLPAPCWALPLGAASLLAASCFPLDDGTDPPLERIYFPVGAELSPAADRLYLANSNFDLQFNAGTVQVLDAAAIRAALPTPCAVDSDCNAARHCGQSADGEAQGLCVDSAGNFCGGLPELDAVERIDAPALCGPLAVDDVLLNAARIAPFVTDLKHTIFTDKKGRSRARLMMPVRGDATLHWADVEDDSAGTGPELDCGQGSGSACDDNHQRGNRASEGQLPDQTTPTEPFSVAVSSDGRAVAVAHQLRGIVSLFSNTDTGPELQYVLDGLPLNPMGLAAVPPPALAAVGELDYEPGFLVSYRHSFSSQPTMELLRYFDASAAAPGAPFLQRSRGSLISPASNGADSRGVAVDDSVRAGCESECTAQACDGTLPNADASAACVACVTECAKLPLTIYVANRSPDALVIGETSLTEADTFRDDVPNFSDAEPLRGGPSRVYVNTVIDERGEPSTRVFVIAFDARLLYIYNPATRTVETRTQTGRGPHALTIDSVHGLAYLAHFTDSYVGVLDLDKRHTTYGEFLLNVGDPTPPRSAR